MISGYLKSSISTVEKRFGLSSQTSGLLAAFNEVVAPHLPTQLLITPNVTLPLPGPADSTCHHSVPRVSLAGSFHSVLAQKLATTC